jgi:hypothetical protein
VAFFSSRDTKYSCHHPRQCRHADRSNKQPRDLWHVVLFYIAGEVTRQELGKKGIEYRPYLYATGLFDRAWPAFREPVERHVRPFVDEQITLDRMATELAQALP